MDWGTVVVSTLGGAGGAIATVYGLSKWLGKVWAEKLLENLKQENRKELAEIRAHSQEEIVKLQSALDRASKISQASVEKATNVTRTQFETEFNAYKQVFEALSDVGAKMDAIGRRTRQVDYNAPESSGYLGRSLAALMDAHNLAMSMARNFSPFYPSEVYDAIQKCLLISGQTVFDSWDMLKKQNVFTEEWWKAEETGLDSFENAYMDVSRIIRQRLASLSVFPA